MPLFSGLRNIMDTTSDIVSEVLVPTSNNIQKIFIERVRYLMERHDSLKLLDIPD